MSEYSPALRAARRQGLCAVCGGQFCTNLYALLMKRPLGGMAVLGVDPVLLIAHAHGVELESHDAT